MRLAPLLLVAALAGTARADEAPAPKEVPREVIEDARRHWQQGIALFTDGNHNAALAEFEASYRIYPAPATLYNIAFTEKALFRYDEAIAHLRQYLAQDKKIAPERQKEVAGMIDELEALLADVRVTVEPDGASVIVDGRAVGKSPLPVLRLAAGRHVIELSAEGRKTDRREITVAAGVRQEVPVVLAKVLQTAHVRITSSAPLATVKVDGRPSGNAPLSVELPAGDHLVEVAAPGYHPAHNNLLLVAGQERALHVPLEPVPVAPKVPVYRRWWFWAAAGGVAAAVAVGTGVGVWRWREDHREPSALVDARVPQ